MAAAAIMAAVVTDQLARVSCGDKKDDGVVDALLEQWVKVAD